MKRILLLVLSLAGCADQPAPSDAAPGVKVQAAKLEPGVFAETETVVGRLMPAPGNVAALTAPMDAVVREVLVQVGQSVEAGRTLIVLDAPELVSEATARRAAADAAERDAARQRELLADGIVSARAVEERQAAAVAARAAADAAEALRARTRIDSPLPGRVQSLLVNPGERVAAGTSLAEIVRDGPVDLVAAVPVKAVTRLAAGQHATVRMDQGGPAVDALVRAVAPAVDSVSGMVTVVIRAGPRSGLIPGAGATAIVTTGVDSAALVLPESALVLVGDSTSVFVVGADSTVTHRPVEVTGRSGGMVSIRGRVWVGDRVVTVGGFGLVDGTKVEPER